MKKKIKDIEVLYNDSIAIDRISNIINHNYNLISSDIDGYRGISLIDNSNNNYLYIDNFDKYFDKLIDNIISDEYFKYSIEDELLPVSLYLGYLENDLDGNIDYDFMPVNDASLEELDLYTGYLYFRDKDKFKDWIKYKDNIINIREELYNREYLEGYSYLLELLYKNTISQNYKDISEEKIEYIINNYNYINEDEYSDREFIKLSDRKLDLLFTNFLEELNEEDWLDFYNYLKRNKRIEYIKKEDSLTSKDRNNNIMITINKTGTLKDFIVLAHEFIHAVIENNNPLSSNLSLREFPSIYFEKLAAKYIEDIGLSNGVEKDVNDFRRYINTINSLPDLEIYNDLLYLDDKLDIDYYIDRSKYIIQNGLRVMDSYMYMIGDDLSHKIIDNNDNISKMIDITNNIYKYNVEDIENIFKLNKVKCKN